LISNPQKYTESTLMILNYGVLLWG